MVDSGDGIAELEEFVLDLQFAEDVQTLISSLDALELIMGSGPLSYRTVEENGTC